MIITLGNQPSGQNGAAIYDVQADGTLTYEFTLSEQGNHNAPLHMTSGEIVIGGADAAFGDDWTAANIYVKDAGVWTKKRTLPNVIHTVGACEHGGKLYVGTGSHTGDNATWIGEVFWSDDFGDTWLGSSVVTSYRVMDIASFSGKLYTQDTTYYTNQVHVSSDGGVSWSEVTGIVPRPRPRMLEYGGSLLIVKQDLLGFATINDVGETSAVDTPLIISYVAFNVAVAVGSDLYVLCGSQSDRIYRYDGAAWSYHCYLGEMCCSLLNFDDEFLIASTVGVDAKILKVQL